MRDIFQNLEWTAIISIIAGAISTLISILKWKKKKDADNRLSELIKNDKDFFNNYQYQIEQILKTHEKINSNLSNTIDYNSQYDLKSLEIKNELQKKELELLKLELLKEEIKKLAESLENSKKSEIDEALNQKSLKGQANYINNILNLSGSTEQIYYDE